MKRLCVAVIGLICAAVGTAEAEDSSPARSKPVHHHPAKATTVQAAASKSEGLGDIRFSDPYAPPVGAHTGTASQFPAIQSDQHAASPGGFSLTAGRDSPDAPFTGGLKFRF